jgi:hypothetical protein
MQTTPIPAFPLESLGDSRRAVNEQEEPKVPPVTPFLRFFASCFFPSKEKERHSLPFRGRVRVEVVLTRSNEHDHA